MKYSSFLLSIFCFVSNTIQAQNYNAIHGSNYAGALGVYNNPSSILSSPYKWDVTVLGFHYQTISNAVKGPNFPFSLFRSAKFYVANGNFKRYADITSDLRLLNTRISLNENNAIAFGLNVRGNVQGRTTPVNYTDSVKGPRSFLSLNEPNRMIELDVASSMWLELYGSYARTIYDRETGTLTAGATLKLMRGMSGAFASAKDVGIVSEQENDQTLYKIENGDAEYGYSSNHGDGESFSTSDFFAQAKTGFAIDLGVEYLVNSQAVQGTFDEESDNDYEWKIGFSLLDIGWNTYAYSNFSRNASRLGDDVTNVVLQEKFSGVTGISSFNDTVATIVNNFSPLTGTFKVMNPTRAVLNIDRYVSGNLYINGDLSVNLASWGRNHRYAVRESKFLTITPRWETRKLGFFFPIQINRHGNFWVGGALKAGALLIGTHNLLNTFARNKFLGSGAYVAFSIRPFELGWGNGSGKGSRSRSYDCPTF